MNFIWRNRWLFSAAQRKSKDASEWLLSAAAIYATELLQYGRDITGLSVEAATPVLGALATSRLRDCQAIMAASPVPLEMRKSVWFQFLVHLRFQLFPTCWPYLHPHCCCPAQWSVSKMKMLFKSPISQLFMRKIKFFQRTQKNHVAILWLVKYSDWNLTVFFQVPYHTILLISPFDMQRINPSGSIRAILINGIGILFLGIVCKNYSTHLRATGSCHSLIIRLSPLRMWRAAWGMRQEQSSGHIPVIYIFAINTQIISAVMQQSHFVSSKWRRSLRHGTTDAGTAASIKRQLIYIIELWPDTILINISWSFVLFHINRNNNYITRAVHLSINSGLGMEK